MKFFKRILHAEDKSSLSLQKKKKEEKTAIKICNKIGEDHIHKLMCKINSMLTQKMKESRLLHHKGTNENQTGKKKKH